MKAVQFFSKAYLQQCQQMSPDDILRFLETFRLLQEPAEKSKLISIKIPENLLAHFRNQCELHGVKYQTQIKQLMRDWLESK